MFLCIPWSLCSSLKALTLTLSSLFLLNAPSRPPDPRWPRIGLGIHEVPGEYLLGKEIYLKTVCMGKIFSPTSPSTRRRENWTAPEAGPLAPECSTAEEEPGTCVEVCDSWPACFPCHSAHLLHKGRFHDGVCACRHPVSGLSSTSVNRTELSWSRASPGVVLPSNASSARRRLNFLEKPPRRISLATSISLSLHRSSVSSTT